MNLRRHPYKGTTIAPCQCSKRDGQGGHYRWCIGPDYHEATGIPYAEEYWTHCYSLPQAREMIDCGQQV